MQMTRFLIVRVQPALFRVSFESCRNWQSSASCPCLANTFALGTWRGFRLTTSVLIGTWCFRCGFISQLSSIRSFTLQDLSFCHNVHCWDIVFSFDFASFNWGFNPILVDVQRTVELVRGSKTIYINFYILEKIKMDRIYRAS